MKYKSLANSYLSTFCMELAMLLEAGIAPLDGVLMLYDDEPGKDGKEVMQSLIDPLNKGVPLSTALRESRYFPRYMVSMVEIGEKTGRLTTTLRALCEYYERQDRLALSIKNAVLYPAILLILMLAVVLILIIQVLPIFNDTFARLGSQMTPLATALMQFGVWLKDVSAVIAVIFGVIILIAIVAWIVPAVRGGIASAFKNMRGNRGVFKDIASSRFISSMALTIASGLDTEEAVQMAAAVSGGTKAVDEKHRQCIEMLRSGSPLAESMFKAGIISARDSRMLALGGRSGKTDAAMAEIAGRSDRNVRDRIDHMIGKLEPTLVIIASVIIGIILLSVMLPLMGIMTSIG